MYLPHAFRETRPERLRALVREHPFGALLVARADGALEISHQPFLLADDGARLRAHVSRANPVVPLIEAGAKATVVFQGPHGYISPRWYSTRAEVPTWSYAVVHAYGVLRAVHHERATRALLTDLAQAFEGERDDAWTLADLPESETPELLRGILAFDVLLERWEGKWKLGQNRALADRHGAIAGLRREGGEASRALADAMEAVLP
jgi:transcriptional regulator